MSDSTQFSSRFKPFSTYKIEAGRLEIDVRGLLGKVTRSLVLKRQVRGLIAALRV